MNSATYRLRFVRIILEVSLSVAVAFAYDRWVTHIPEFPIVHDSTGLFHESAISGLVRNETLGFRTEVWTGRDDLDALFNEREYVVPEFSRLLLISFNTEKPSAEFRVSNGLSQELDPNRTAAREFEDGLVAARKYGFSFDFDAYAGGYVRALMERLPPEYRENEKRNTASEFLYYLFIGAISFGTFLSVPMIVLSFVVSGPASRVGYSIEEGDFLERLKFIFFPLLVYGDYLVSDLFDRTISSSVWQNIAWAFAVWTIAAVAYRFWSKKVGEYLATRHAVVMLTIFGVSFGGMIGLVIAGLLGVAISVFSDRFSRA